MRYLVWLTRLLVFVVVLMFALKNTQTVAVHFLADATLADVPLVVVLLVTFIVGMLLGLLLTVPTALRRRREAARLKREVARLQAEVGGINNAPLPAEAITPMSPL